MARQMYAYKVMTKQFPRIFELIQAPDIQTASRHGIVVLLKGNAERIGGMG